MILLLIFMLLGVWTSMSRWHTASELYSLLFRFFFLYFCRQCVWQPKDMLVNGAIMKCDTLWQKSKFFLLTCWSKVNNTLAGILWNLPLAVRTVWALASAFADIPCISPCSVLRPCAAVASGPPPLSAALPQQQGLQFLPLLWSAGRK